MPRATDECRFRCHSNTNHSRLLRGRRYDSLFVPWAAGGWYSYQRVPPWRYVEFAQRCQSTNMLITYGRTEVLFLAIQILNETAKFGLMCLLYHLADNYFYKVFESIETSKTASSKNKFSEVG